MKDKTNVSNVYDKIAIKYSKEFSNPSEYLDFFLELIPKKGRILDFGCGVGVDSNYMFSKGFFVTGIDISKGMLEIARKNYPEVSFKLKDIRDIEENGVYDGIVASCSLIHIPKEEVPETLRKFNNLLNKRGIIYISLQEGSSEEVFVDEPFKPDEKLFLNIISFNEIKQLLDESNFSIIKHYQRKPKTKEELNYNKLFIIARKK